MATRSLGDLLSVNACVICGRSLAAHRDTFNRSIGCVRASRREQPLDTFAAPARQSRGHLHIVQRAPQVTREEAI